MNEREYTSEGYLKLHNSCGLKVGDKVKVLRAAKDCEQGWSNTWADSMDEYIGSEAYIMDDDSASGFALTPPDPDDFYFLFPCFVLEKVESDTTPSYYGGKENPYEAIKVIQAWDLGFELGNVLKYISRAGKKTPDALSDLKKAAAYLQYEIQKREKK